MRERENRRNDDRKEESNAPSPEQRGELVDAFLRFVRVRKAARRIGREVAAPRPCEVTIGFPIDMRRRVRSMHLPFRPSTAFLRPVART